MRKIVLIIFSLGSFLFPSSSYAASQSECAIWLCLPGGFPTGCAAAHSAFRDRIKHGKSPLPDLSSCIKGPDGATSNGTYEMGDEKFFPCKSGFEIDEGKLLAFGEGVCVPTSPACRSSFLPKGLDCKAYTARKRVQTHYIKMWVDGKYVGKFFYR